MTPPRVIHWFRRDLRLSDNLALAAALESGADVIPVFIFDPAILRSPRIGPPRLAFMLSALHSLDTALRERGSGLLIRHGDPRAVLPALARDLNARAIYFNRDYSPFARRRDEQVRAVLPVPVHSFDDAVLHAPGRILKPDGQPYTVYTPFKNQIRALPHPLRPVDTTLAPGHLARLPGNTSSPLPDLAELGFDSTIPVPPASEEIAQRRLATFVNGSIYAYSEGRNRLIHDPFADNPPPGASYLSPYFRFGLLSPRQAYWAAQAGFDRAPDSATRQAVTTWVDEVIWREFYIHILYHFPHVDRGNFRREYDALPWRDAPDELQAWKAGRTGYPVVDAAMRQLQQVGWLPNRARMIVASFLTKDLLIHWQEGERHFMQWLIDGDIAANNGGWQWTAGTGTDAQPYFRIFNPVSQSRTHDPDGAYIRRWVPELRDIPAEFIHTPWEMDRLPQDYPPPLVDHTSARERALATFGAIKGHSPA